MYTLSFTVEIDFLSIFGGFLIFLLSVFHTPSVAYQRLYHSKLTI